MAGVDLAFPGDELYAPEGTSDPGSRITVVYHMRALDDGDSTYKRWTNDNVPDRFGIGINAPTPVGNLTDIIVEKTSEKVKDTNNDGEVLWQWNGRDLSQFTLVKGNGIGGHGSGGDHVLTLDTFANDDAPALNFTTTGTSNHAIWLINDFTDPLPGRFQLSWRGLNPTINSHREGIIFYYEDNDHFIMIMRTDGSDISLAIHENAAFGSRPDIGRVSDTFTNRDTTFGDCFGATCHLQVASGSNEPWVIAKAGGETESGYGEPGEPWLRTGAFGDGSANTTDASWTGLGSYSPRIGLFVEGGSPAGTLHMGGLCIRRAYGGV